MKKTNSTEIGSLPLGRKEYKLLVTMLYQSLFLNQSIVTQETGPELEAMSDLVRKIISYAEEFGNESLVSKDILTDSVFANTAFTENVIERLSDYDEINFWEELIHRLAERDILHEYGVDIVMDEPSEDILIRFEQKLIEYTSHFEENGLKYISLNRSEKGDSES